MTSQDFDYSGFWCCRDYDIRDCDNLGFRLSGLYAIRISSFGILHGSL